MPRRPTAQILGLLRCGSTSQRAPMTTAHALLEARIERNPRYTTNRVTPTKFKSDTRFEPALLARHQNRIRARSPPTKALLVSPSAGFTY